MSDEAPLIVRERAVLTVFDHSGAEPRAVEEIEVVMEHGAVVSRIARAIGAWEASRHLVERVGGGHLARGAAYARDIWRQTLAYIRGSTED